jgi:molybdopterin converting factor subunit 1
VRVRVLFFGVIREIVGVREDTVDIAEGTSPVDLLMAYQTNFPRLKDVLPSVAFAVNQKFANPDATIAEGDEIAFLPPVSGGSATFTHTVEHEDGHLFALTRDPIDAAAIARRILRGEDGAFVNFEGVARNNSKGRATRFLEYECYEPMAIQVMTTLGLEIAQAHPIGRVAMIHRLGRIEIGETSVAVVVTSPHRKPAFDAALEGINRLKRTVPIWKKEFFVDGEVWVDGEWDESVIRARA